MTLATEYGSAEKRDKTDATLALRRILVALDNSDHANRALAEAVKLGGPDGGEITGIHAYAAQLHDRRFRQMEGGLPERYLNEDEMEHQREVHDDLISHGLNVISDSYHDVGERVCGDANVPYRRLSPEGKNYSQIVDSARSGDFDLLVLGALGLGAVPGSLVGTVCERVVRRSPIDTLVIRDPNGAIGDGPIVVGLDGSGRSFGALKTAFAIGRQVGARVHAVAAYDPYYHYVAFNKIAGVLSEEAGKVFRFKEQEKLHEELIDDGLAKIYESHLEIAKHIAAEDGIDITCELLDGKAYHAILKYLEKVDASLLVVGKTGVHADSELDIGGNAENLLRLAPCHVWFGVAEHQPELDVVAEETIAWSKEAEDLLARAPSFARDMARKAVLRHAQQRGHTYITTSIVNEVAALLMPGRGAAVEEEKATVWSADAAGLIEALPDSSLAANIRLRAEKFARREGAAEVTVVHVQRFLGDDAMPALPWAAAALARLSRVPEAMRDQTRARIETVARQRGVAEVTLELVEAGLVEARRAMAEAVGAAGERPEVGEQARVEWTPAAEERMQKVPTGYARTLTRQRIEAFARRQGVGKITAELVDEKYAEWAAGSAKRKMSLPWQQAALARIERIPGFVRGMVMLEIERCAREMGKDTVTDEVIEQSKGAWERGGGFHSESDPDLYGSSGS